jgi:hypothetical protein
VNRAVRIEYTTRDFGASWGPKLTGRGGALDVRFLDVFAAALTVGRPSWPEVMRYGFYSRAELVYRTFQILANLVPRYSGLARSPGYDGLDPSEKAAVSYSCGLTFAKLAAERLFAVPFLQHIACYPPDSIQYATTRRLDLAGMDASGRWYVVEAKGRSNGVEATLLAEAKQQTRGVRSVAGKPPYLRLAMAAGFRGGVLRLQFEDPDDDHAAREEWNITPAQTLGLHYAPWLAIIDTFGGEERTWS